MLGKQNNGNYVFYMAQLLINRQDFIFKVAFDTEAETIYLTLIGCWFPHNYSALNCCVLIKLVQ